MLRGTEVLGGLGCGCHQSSALDAFVRLFLELIKLHDFADVVNAVSIDGWTERLHLRGDLGHIKLGWLGNLPGGRLLLGVVGELMDWGFERVKF